MIRFAKAALCGGGWLILLASISINAACNAGPTPLANPPEWVAITPAKSGATPTRPRIDRANPSLDIGTRIALAAEDQVGVTTIYDPSFVTLAYPNGDIPIERGVCTDVIVRAFRAIGIDLQVRLHEDMAKSFGVYLEDWGLEAPDPNIDHRRVQNLVKYSERMGKQINSTADESSKPGDIVAWQLSGWMQHIGIVAVDIAPGTNRHCIIHNVGAGTQKEDVLRSFTIIEHYRVKLCA